jgi:hypothetical protein
MWNICASEQMGRNRVVIVASECFHPSEIPL